MAHTLLKENRSPMKLHPSHLFLFTALILCIYIVASHLG